MQNNDSVDICIVGLGPSGIGAALTLSNNNLQKNILCIDFGEQMNHRSCPIIGGGSCEKENPCKMISGFGGCSLLGGGKISKFPAGSQFEAILGSKDLAERKLSEAFELFSSYLLLDEAVIPDEDIKHTGESFRDLGFNYKYYNSFLFTSTKMRSALERILSVLDEKKINISLSTQLKDITIEPNGFKLSIIKENKEFIIKTKYLIMGLGRTGNGLLMRLNKKLDLGGKYNHLEVGVRLEFPDKLVRNIIKNHNDLKLLFDDARTFCTCRNGRVAAYRLNDTIFTEGHLDPMYRTSFTNIGIMVRLKASKHNELILRYIEKSLHSIKMDRPIRQCLIDYLNLNPENTIEKFSNKDMQNQLIDTLTLRSNCDLSLIFPPTIAIKVEKAVNYFVSNLFPDINLEYIYVYGPEIDYGGLSFPIKADFSITQKMYLIGESAGRFRGILQAFASGIVCGESVIKDIYEKK